MPELLYMCVAVLALIVNIIKQKNDRETRSLQMLYKKRRAELHRYARPYSYATICKRNVCIITDLLVGAFLVQLFGHKKKSTRLKIKSL